MRIYNIEYKSRIHTVKCGETVETIAVKYNTTAGNIKKLNAVTDEIAAGDMLFIGDLDKKVHIVMPLETVDSIAAKYNVTSMHIRLLNGITTLYVGQRILI